MVGYDEVPKKDLNSTSNISMHVLRHMAMIHRRSDLNARDVRLNLILERNYGDGLMAAVIANEIRNIRTRTAREVNELIPLTDLIDIYTCPTRETKYTQGTTTGATTSARGNFQPGTGYQLGFMTSNENKGYGVFRIRQRLEQQRTAGFAFPMEGISTRTPNLDTIKIMERTVNELTNFEIHVPTPLNKLRATHYHGKRGGNTDDLVMCILMTEVVHCRDCNATETQIYNEIADSCGSESLASNHGATAL